MCDWAQRVVAWARVLAVLGLSLVVAACSVRRNVRAVDKIGVRVEPVVGFDVIVPADAERGAGGWVAEPCQPEMAAGSDRQLDSALSCSWYNARERRLLSFSWIPNVFGVGARSEERLRYLVDVFALDASGELSRLSRPCDGWEWRVRADGDFIRDRFYVVGGGYLMLKAVSSDDDSFELGQSFLESLTVGIGVMCGS